MDSGAGRSLVGARSLTGLGQPNRAVPPGADGLVFLTALTGERFPSLRGDREGLDRWFASLAHRRPSGAWWPKRAQLALSLQA